MLRTHEFQITGYLVGPIWWPGSDCWKVLDYNLSREDGRLSQPGTLRDHILRATNDGDFSSCSIAQGELIARRTFTRGSRRIVEKRAWSLDQFPTVADCLHADPDWLPDYGEE